MKTNSRTIDSNQKDIHPDLQLCVAKHLASDFKRPIAAHNTDTYHEAIAAAGGRPIIFDSGCGTGRSSMRIAAENPHAFVIGIDKSLHRLEKNSVFHQSTGDNLHLARADLIDFWRLASDDNIRLEKHFLLYPNPWPKKKHMQRRWHGSPLFRQLLKLGGQLELRSNWEIYTREFMQALNTANYHSTLQRFIPEINNSISDFEEKYHRSGHSLWQLIANLDIDSAATATENSSTATTSD